MKSDQDAIRDKFTELHILVGNSNRQTQQVIFELRNLVNSLFIQFELLQLKVAKLEKGKAEI